MKFYSVNEVSVSFAGLGIESGKTDDTFVEIEQDNERFSLKAGVDGSSTMSEDKGNSHTVTIYLMQSSDGNDKLSAIYKLAEKSAGGTLGVAPLMIRDKQGNSVFVCLEAFITGWPKKAYAKEVGTLQWKLKCANPERFEGGNSGT